MSEAMLRTERRGDVLALTLDRPDRLNAAPPALFDAIRAALAERGDARAILIAGEGRAFCSGADISGGDVGPDTVHRALVDHYNPVMLALADLPIPVVSAVRGAAAGIGCSLALAADFCVASESAYFLHAFVNIGMVSDGGASWMLPRLIGRARAAEMMMLGERVGAAKALDWGMVHKVVADDALDAEAWALAERLAAGPSVALGLMRRALHAGFESDYAAALAREAQDQRRARASLDGEEGGRAFFEKRPPRFLGR